jgi:hypothetical protein
MTIPEHAIGLSFYFEVGGHADPQVLARLVTDSIPVIRRYLDDPISATAIGQRPEPARNAFLAAFLAIDRAGYEPGTLSVLPAAPACVPVAHATGGRCPLCAVLHVIALAQREKLIRVRAIAGDKNDQGRYVSATDIALEPGEAIPDFRERIKRLSLPLLMAGPSGAAEPEPVAGQTRQLLPTVRASSWTELAFDLQAAGFVVAGLSGNRADLGLSRGLWTLLGEFARGSGQIHAKVLGGADPLLAARVDELRAALKRAFPQVAGNPIESLAGGGFQTAFAISAGDLPQGSLRWGSD